jgi:hypothetical protein
LQFLRHRNHGLSASVGRPRPTANWITATVRRGRLTESVKFMLYWKKEILLIRRTRMKQIEWILQANLTRRDILDKIESALQQDAIPFQEVVVIPFSNQLPLIVASDSFKVFYGSTTLMLNAYNSKQYSQGVFYNDSFTMQNYLKQWGDKMLNSDAIITKLLDFVNHSNDLNTTYFIRPNEDNKAFSGVVMSFKELREFNKEIKDSGNPHFPADMVIAASKPKHIVKEWRNFIVNKEVISACRYAKNNKLDVSADDVPVEMIKFTEAACRQYTPHDIFVIDIGLVNEKYYIIECNCFNGTGFYDNDIKKIVTAINRFLNKNLKAWLT